MAAISTAPASAVRLPEKRNEPSTSTQWRKLPPAMGPALTLGLVGGRGPHPGRGLLQLEEGLELGQLQQLRLRGGVGHRRRRHLDGLALGESPGAELVLRRRQ